MKVDAGASETDGDKVGQRSSEGKDGSGADTLLKFWGRGARLRSRHCGTAEHAEQLFCTRSKPKTTSESRERERCDGARVRPNPSPPLPLWVGAGVGGGATSHVTPHYQGAGHQGSTAHLAHRLSCQRKRKSRTRTAGAGARVGTAGKGEGERAKEGQSQERPGDVLS